MLSPDSYSQVSLTLVSSTLFKRRRQVNSSNVFSEVKKGRLRDELVESNMRAGARRQRYRPLSGRGRGGGAPSEPGGGEGRERRAECHAWGAHGLGGSQGLTDPCLGRPWLTRESGVNCTLYKLPCCPAPSQGTKSGSLRASQYCFCRS